MSREDTAKEEGVMKARDPRQRNIPEETERERDREPKWRPRTHVGEGTLQC